MRGRAARDGLALHDRRAVGDACVEMLRGGFVWALLGLAALHVGGVIFTSFRPRENLVCSMLNGEKRAPRGDDVA